MRLQSFKAKLKISLGLAVLAAATGLLQSASAAEKAPYISTFSRPVAGTMQMLFHGTGGPFKIQTRASLDGSSPWVDVPTAIITELQPGVMMANVPMPNAGADLRFYQVVSLNDPSTEVKAWTVLLDVSAPANGSFFAVGESPVVTVTILDTLGQGLSSTDFGSLNLYMEGPQDSRRTVTAAKLLGASTDRSTGTHHYLNLKGANGNVQGEGNVFTCKLNPVSDEQPGTYFISLWATLSADGTQQMMKFANVQIGTGAAELPVVTKTKCAACHEGPISGKIYMHHIDPGFSPAGNWALDFEPVTSCKSCHNNDGYAAYTDATGAKVPDPIVRRVHGVHMGSGLKLPFNTNQTTGDFKVYTDLEFPAEVKNCTTCHVDNRWKTEPSRLACGSCHDNIWFGSGSPPAGWDVHGGGQQKDDTKCATCHAPDPDPSNLFDSITENHQIPPAPLNSIAISLTAPGNGSYYASGDKPIVSLVFQNDAGQSIGDHSIVDAAHFSTAQLFVYGPRSSSQPVLTSLADLGVETKRPSVSCSVGGPWDINGKTFKIDINGSGPQNIVISGTAGAVTAAQVVASLNSVITNYSASASASGTKVTIASLVRGAASQIAIYNGDVTTAMGWKAPGVVLDPDVTVAAVSTAGNDLRPVNNPLDFNDPRVTRTSTNVQYQLDDVAGLSPGTYCVFAYYTPKTASAGLTNWAGLGFTTFQVGTTNVEKKVAGNCRDCHSATPFHLYEKIGEPAMSAHVHPAMFDPDQCKACHDYGHSNTGEMFKNQGGTSLNGWSGFGAMPISRRVHGVHFGHYLDHPEEIYANATKDTFGGIIFPQDVRNCTKCHAESDSWKQKPSRIACLACHDSDSAKAHGKLMTYIATPSDPFGPSAQESCEICHGADAEFSPDKVHAISKPYVPPYPRD